MLARLSPSVRLALYYFFFSAAWILTSGKIAGLLAGGNAASLRLIEDFKGLFFVLVSSLFIYSLSRGIYKKLMTSLQENKEMLRKYQAVMNATKEGIYEYDIKTETAKLSDNIKEILGEEATVKKNGLKYWQKHMHPEDRKRILEEIKKTYTKGQNFWQGEYRFLTSQKQYKEVLHRIYILKDKEQHPYSIVGALQDITEQRQQQREYHAQQLKNKTEITRNIINAEERERNRWAEELHDNIAQTLGVVKLYVGMISSQPENEKEMIQKTTELVDLSITEIRQLSANLKPPVFEEKGLKEAIQNLIAIISRVKDLNFILQINDAICDQYLNDEQKLMIYRIVQEQLNNIIKYAGARNVLIQIEIDHPRVMVRIKDDGIGFDADKLESGIGLKNIRGRLNLFNGNLEVISAPGRGCELRSEFWLN
ncbi:MAG TPA: PAS domain-containing protein [Chitinophagaceae bacterium]|nr:PAS domain-containing protein [Chitinophagaceae bacterium]